MRQFEVGDIIICKCPECLSKNSEGSLIGVIIALSAPDGYEIMDERGLKLKIFYSQGFLKTNDKKLEELFSMLLLGDQ